MSNRSVCFVGAGLKTGGHERSLSSLANYFAANGHKVVVINLFRTEQFFHLDERIDVFWPDIERTRLNRFVYAVLIIPYLRRSIRKAKPDFIFSYGEWFNPYVILSTFFLKIPVFVLDRMGPKIDLGLLIETSRKVLYRFATGVIVQTKIAAEIIKRKTKAKNIGIVPNPVNVINTNTSIRYKQIVTVGRLSKEKGHIVLLRAFARLKDKDWTLHIIGDGPERKNLIKETLLLGIEGRVIFHGQLKNFGKVLGESIIFVLPSYYEGFPNSLIEAMSVPLACISSNCIAGPEEIISNRINGILVEPGNVDELHLALEEVINKPELASDIAREAYKVREVLSFEKIASLYLDFVDNCVK